MKSPMPWFCLIAAANAGMAFADEGLDAYRQGNYEQAALQLKDTSGKDSIVEYYMGRMRLYGYGQLKIIHWPCSTSSWPPIEVFYQLSK